jgi:hypothetical protein
LNSQGLLQHQFSLFLFLLVWGTVGGRQKKTTNKECAMAETEKLEKGIKEFRVLFPQATVEIATDYLLNNQLDLQKSIDAYIAILSDKNTTTKSLTKNTATAQNTSPTNSPLIDFDAGPAPPGPKYVLPSRELDILSTFGFDPGNVGKATFPTSHSSLASNILQQIDNSDDISFSFGRPPKVGSIPIFL